jgi:hypothetical protein
MVNFPICVPTWELWNWWAFCTLSMPTYSLFTFTIDTSAASDISDQQHTYVSVSYHTHTHTHTCALLFVSLPLLPNGHSSTVSYHFHMLVILLDDTKRTNVLCNDIAILQLFSVIFFISFQFILDDPHTISVTKPEILQKLENYSNYPTTR